MPGSTIIIQRCLDRLRASDPSARQDLVRHSYQRLEILTPARKNRFGGNEQTGDVLHDLVIRLDQALQKVQPESVAAYFALASKHIRYVLLNAAGKRFVTSEKDAELADSAAGPATLTEGKDMLARMHQEVERLPEDLLPVVDLLFYQGLTQEEAGKYLQLDERTVRRRWRKAREILHDALGGKVLEAISEIEGQA